MYDSFYGLRRGPFEISPDPYFLVPTVRHTEALASLYYGVTRHKGFVVMTGDVGTGKTLLVRCLLELLRRRQAAFAHVFNPALSVVGFLRQVATDFGLPPCGKSKIDFLLQLNNYLISRCQKGLTSVLVVDEAQHLHRGMLEEIRLLTNLETSQQKLLQIVLVGQSELEQQLQYSDLRQLRQRIALWCRLGALTEEETAQYIERRLTLASIAPRAEPLFAAEAIAIIYQYTRGVPRLINIMCDNALVAAFAHQKSQVTMDIIEEIAADLCLKLCSPDPLNGGNCCDTAEVAFQKSE